MLNIIIPTFNSTATLPRALGSLVSQTKQQFMLTIVDDCSYIGDVKQILSEFTHVLKCPISYLQTEVNSGPGAARQLGIDRTDEKIDYVMFLDSDDLLMPHAVELLTKEIAITGADIVVSNFLNDKFNKTYDTYEINQNKTWLHGKIYRLPFLRKYQIRFPPVRYNEDTGFNLQAYELAEKKAYLDVETYLYRDNLHSLTHQSKAFLVEHCLDFLKSIFESLNHVYEYKVNEKLDSFTALCLRQMHMLYEMIYQYDPSQIESISNYCTQILNSSNIALRLESQDFLQYLAFYSTFPINLGELVVFPKLSFRKFLEKFRILPYNWDALKDLTTERICLDD